MYLGYHHLKFNYNVVCVQHKYLINKICGVPMNCNSLRFKLFKENLLHKPKLMDSFVRTFSTNFPFILKKNVTKNKISLADEKKKVSHLYLTNKMELPNTSKFSVLTNQEIKSTLSRLNNDERIKSSSMKDGLDSNVFLRSFISFRKVCLDTPLLPVDLHLAIYMVKYFGASPMDIYPYLLRHAKKLYPHLDIIGELEEMCNLQLPESIYADARKMKRKLVYHSGPTNSGKTYNAMQSFLKSESSIYCGPLRLLALEVYHKSNISGVPCNLVTGEERKLGLEDYSEYFPHIDKESYEVTHLACTAEMIPLDKKFQVGVIDEIQTIRDLGRGWAWTRALLGLQSEELHICGESSACNIAEVVANKCGDSFEVNSYKRLTELKVEDHPLGSVDNIQPGDCIVCFSRERIARLVSEVQALGHEVAVIYGNLPPATKLEMANKFNDPKHPCKIMIATDAIGMGLNLSIRRIIFDSLLQTCETRSGLKTIEDIKISTALQIAGRAGRFGTQWEEGYVTAIKSKDLEKLKVLLKQSPPQVEKMCIQPELDVYELFSYHMPDYSFSLITDIARKLCKIDESSYFLSSNDNCKALSEKLLHIPLSFPQRYTLSNSPINVTQLYECQMFVKFARHIAENQRVTAEWLMKEIQWPSTSPTTTSQLFHLESVYNVLELYCWLSFNYPKVFADESIIRKIKCELEDIISKAVDNFGNLHEENRFSNNKFTKSVSKNEIDESSDSVMRYFLENESELSNNYVNESVDFRKQNIQVTYDANEHNFDQSMKGKDAYVSENVFHNNYDEFASFCTSTSQKLVHSKVLTSEDIKVLRNEWLAQNKDSNSSNFEASIKEDSHLNKRNEIVFKNDDDEKENRKKKLLEMYDYENFHDNTVKSSINYVYYLSYNSGYSLPKFDHISTKKTENDQLVYEISVSIGDFKTSAEGISKTRAKMLACTRLLQLIKDEISSLKIKDESTLKIEDNSSVRIEDESTLKVEDQSFLKIEDEPTLKIEDQSSLKMEDQPTLKIEDESTLKMEDESTLKIEDETSTLKTKEKSTVKKNNLKEEQKLTPAFVSSHYEIQKEFDKDETITLLSNSSEADQITLKNTIQYLYEFCQKNSVDSPKFILIESELSAQNIWKFVYNVHVKDSMGCGEGPTKKKAKLAAAIDLVSVLNKKYIENTSDSRKNIGQQDKPLV